MSDVLSITALAGSGTSLAGIMFTLGYLKGKIEQHDRILNTFTQEAVIMLVRKGMAQQQSDTKVDPALLSEKLRFLLDDIIASGHSKMFRWDDTLQVVNKLAKLLPEGTFAELAVDKGITLSEAVGLCILYCKQSRKAG